MSEDAAAEWIAVAAMELAGYRRTLVDAALSDARKVCTFHGKIVPHAIKWMEEATPWRMGKPLARNLPRPAAPRALPAPEVTALIGETTRALKPRHPGYTD